jgi:hypothetical protein
MITADFASAHSGIAGAGWDRADSFAFGHSCARFAAEAPEPDVWRNRTGAEAAGDFGTSNLCVRNELPRKRVPLASALLSLPRWRAENHTFSAYHRSVRQSGPVSGHVGFLRSSARLLDWLEMGQDLRADGERVYDYASAARAQKEEEGGYTGKPKDPSPPTSPWLFSGNNNHGHKDDDTEEKKKKRKKKKKNSHKKDTGTAAALASDSGVRFGLWLWSLFVLRFSLQLQLQVGRMHKHAPRTVLSNGYLSLTAPSI